MVLVILIDSTIGGERKKTNEFASHSARRSMAWQDSTLGPGVAACRWAAIKGCRHDAPGHIDFFRSPVAPVHAVVAVSVRIEYIVSGGVLGSLS